MNRYLPFALVAIVSLFGAILPHQPPAVSGGPINTGDVAWMLTATALVLLMTPGLSFFYGGMVQPKNVISTMLQSFMAMGLMSVLWLLVGFSLAFGDDIGGIIGNPATFFMFNRVGGATHPDLAPTIPLVVFGVFQLKFAIITPALITGSFAERVRFSSCLLFMGLFSIFVYTPLAHMTWHPQGIFRQWGVLDFAGGTVVHLSAGCAALVGALVLGRRRSHIEQRPHVPANIPFVILGTGMLWFGWFGFNAGSALGASAQASMALRPRTPPRRPRRSRGSPSTCFAAGRRRRLARVSARSWASSRSLRQPVTSISVPACSSGRSRPSSATWSSTGRTHPASTTRWTSSPAMGSAEWWGWCAPPCSRTTSA